MARWLKVAREAGGKTQREAGNFLDVDSQTVSNWETAKHPINVEDLLRLAAFYGADARELFTAPGRPEWPANLTHPDPLRPNQTEKPPRKKGRAG